MLVPVGVEKNPGSSCSSTGVPSTVLTDFFALIGKKKIPHVPQVPFVFHRMELNPLRLNINTGTTGIDLGFSLSNLLSVHFVPKFLKWDITGTAGVCFSLGNGGLMLFDVPVFPWI